MTDLETLTQAYIEAIYFTETGDRGQPPADAELTALCKQQAWVSCRNFHQAITREVPTYLPPLDWVRVGHDLWLTRNGHGVGFWGPPGSLRRGRRAMAHGHGGCHGRTLLGV